MNRIVCGTNYRAIIIFLALHFLMKNKLKLVYGDSGIQGISNNITRCDTPIC